MSVLAISDLLQLAANAGFTGPDLFTAVSIALAESGGNPNAYNPETAAHTPTGEGSYGLWQIYLKAHPEYQGQNLYDPQTNANAAFAVYSNAGGSFRPWSTFGNGTYNQYLAAVEAQAPSAPAPPVAADATDTTDSGNSGDGSSSSGSGFSPSGGDVAMMAFAGILALWAATRLIG